MKETLNLLQVEVKAGAAAKKGRFYYLLAGIAVYIVVIMGLYFLNIINVKKLGAEMDKLNKQKAELQQQIKPLPAVTVAPSLLVDKEILIAMEKSPRWSPILSTISVVVPQDVWLSSIESREEKGAKHMSIKGFSTTQLGVANFIAALELSHHFYDVEIVFVQKGDKDISFELKAKMRWR
ncbi:MAG: PilN domain-containing protein [Thermodesulfovibrionales bacterium]|nr:PilN domain-containing protein [Thermodesulfovibrionales bacterium]